jgi:hypothetical protein
MALTIQTAARCGALAAVQVGVQVGLRAGLRVGLRVGLLVGALLALPPAAAQPQGPSKDAAPAAAPKADAARHGMHKRGQLGSSASFAPDGTLWVAGVDTYRRLVVWTSADRGRTFAPPRTLDTGSDVISADGESRPKLAFGPHGVVVIAYTQPLARPYTGEIRMLRSIDRGATFGAPFTVHQDRQVITHRFESIAFDADGTLHVLWVDKRDMEAAKIAGKPYRGAAIYRTWSPDGGASFAPDTPLADYSCECCRIALAPAPEGGLMALWRHVFEPNLRDHAALHIDDRPANLATRAAAPVRASFDGWALDACPHHGPGLAPAAGGGYHAVWFGERAGVQAVRTGRLDANGAPVGAVRTLPDAEAEHADVVTHGRRVAVVWRSHDPQLNDMRLRAWLSDDDGASFTLHELGRTNEPNDHPRLAKDAAGSMVVVWRNAKEIRVVPLQP